MSLNCTHSFLLNSFFYFMRSIQISIWNEQENLNSVCANSVSKSLGLFASLPGHIMTSIVKIQLARLVALLTSFNRKSSKLQQDGYPMKTIRLRWLFMAALNSLPPLDKILSIVFLIHNDPQLITRWAHGTAVLPKKWKNIVCPSNPHLNFRYLSKILNLTTEMRCKWVTYRLSYRKYQTAPRTRVRLSNSTSCMPTSYATLTTV